MLPRSFFICRVSAIFFCINTPAHRADNTTPFLGLNTSSYALPDSSYPDGNNVSGMTNSSVFRFRKGTLPVCPRHNGQVHRNRGKDGRPCAFHDEHGNKFRPYGPAHVSGTPRYPYRDKQLRCCWTRYSFSRTTHLPSSISGSACLYFISRTSPLLMFCIFTRSLRPILGWSRT